MIIELVVLNTLALLILSALPSRESRRLSTHRREAKEVLRERNVGRTGAAAVVVGGVTRAGRSLTTGRSGLRYGMVAATVVAAVLFAAGSGLIGETATDLDGATAGDVEACTAPVHGEESFGAPSTPTVPLEPILVPVALRAAAPFPPRAVPEA